MGFFLLFLKGSLIFLGLFCCSLEILEDVGVSVFQRLRSFCIPNVEHLFGSCRHHRGATPPNTDVIITEKDQEAYFRRCSTKAQHFDNIIELMGERSFEKNLNPKLYYCGLPVSSMTDCSSGVSALSTSKVEVWVRNVHPFGVPPLLEFSPSSNIFYPENIDKPVHISEVLLSVSELTRSRYRGPGPRLEQRPMLFKKLGLPSPKPGPFYRVIYKK